MGGDAKRAGDGDPVREIQMQKKGKISTESTARREFSAVFTNM